LQHMEPVHHHCLSHTHGTPSAAHIIYDFQQVGILIDWESESLLSGPVWIDSQSVMPFLSYCNAGTSYLPSQLCCSTQVSVCLFTDSDMELHHLHCYSSTTYRFQLLISLVTIQVLNFCLGTHKTTYLFTIPKTLWKSVVIIVVIKNNLWQYDASNTHHIF
jgi:hypothetical protein